MSPIPPVPDDGEPAVSPTDLEAARHGDHAAFTRLVESLIDRLYSFSRYMCSDPEDAEDVVQDTLLTAYRKLADYRGEGSLRSWLFRIISTRCQKVRRRRVGEPERHLPFDELSPAALHQVREGPALATVAALPLDELVRTELMGRVEAAIADLPEEYRMVLILRDVEEFSTAEAAEITGLTAAAVKSRLHRARLTVRLALQPYLEEVVR